jgi:hypothetical protein
LDISKPFLFCNNGEIVMKKNGKRSNAIYDTTWKGKYWGWHGAIRLAVTNFLLGKSNLSALSSTFYSASGASTGVRKYACAIIALKLSELFAATRLCHLDRMTPDQRDIRGTILAMAGEYCPIPLLKRWYLNRAIRYAQSIVYSTSLGECVNSQTKCLACALLVKLYISTGLFDRAEREYKVLSSLALRTGLVPEVETRVYRSMGDIECIIGEREIAEMCFEHSCDIAKKADLEDAMNKTKAVAASHGIYIEP